MSEKPTRSGGCQKRLPASYCPLRGKCIEFRKALAKIDPKAFVTLHKIDSVWGQDKDFQDIKKIDMA